MTYDRAEKLSLVCFTCCISCYLTRDSIDPDIHHILGASLDNHTIISLHQNICLSTPLIYVVIIFLLL